MSPYEHGGTNSGKGNKKKEEKTPSSFKFPILSQL